MKRLVCLLLRSVAEFLARSEHGFSMLIFRLLYARAVDAAIQDRNAIIGSRACLYGDGQTAQFGASIGAKSY